MKILIVNDDSIDSPFLTLLLEQLPADAEVLVAVPAQEQSWKGKAMTRFGELKAEQTEIGGYPAMAIHGTPADCTNIGIYHSPMGKPDMVISGINIGHNSGVSYVFSSGTVGAALEANIAGIPALALSQQLPDTMFNEWVAARAFADDSLEYFRRQITDVFARLWARFAEPLASKRPITWSVNLPGELRTDWQLVPSKCGHSFYQSCFSSVAQGFAHAGPHPIEDEREDSDIRVLSSGHVSVTEFDIRSFGQTLASL